MDYTQWKRCGCPQKTPSCSGSPDALAGVSQSVISLHVSQAWRGSGMSRSEILLIMMILSIVDWCWCLKEQMSTRGEDLLGGGVRRNNGPTPGPMPIVRSNPWHRKPLAPFSRCPSSFNVNTKSTLMVTIPHVN